MARILLLEDDLDFGKLVQTGLEGVGYEVVLCEGATAALKLLEEEDFDLLIADLFIKVDGKMVADGGILLIGRIRAATFSDGVLARHGNMPIVAISGGVHFPLQDSILKIAQSVGATKALAKPFDQDELLRTIEPLLKPDDT